MVPPDGSPWPRRARRGLRYTKRGRLPEPPRLGSRTAPRKFSRPPRRSRQLGPAPLPLPPVVRAQAVVARTYAYRNTDRHMLDGFNLCDDTHCQVYPGVISETNLIDACRSTAGKVETDSDSMLIISAFHANCGGQTAASSDVWVSAHPYLIRVTDPYCISSPSARWVRILPATKWNDFLKLKGIAPGGPAPVITSPQAEAKRTRYLIIADKTVSYEEIRIGLNLRSSFFTVIPGADSVIIRGRGYGHGVGLCQDGARVMASQGKSYQEITAFYYPGTAVMDVKFAKKPVRP